MLELQSLQKEKRREQLFKLQTNDTAPAVDVTADATLASNKAADASRKTSFITSLDEYNDDRSHDLSTTANDRLSAKADDLLQGSHNEVITVGQIEIFIAETVGNADFRAIILSSTQPQNSISDVDDDDEYDTNTESLADEEVNNVDDTVLERFDFMQSYDEAQPTHTAIDSGSERPAICEQIESVESTNQTQINHQEVGKAVTGLTPPPPLPFPTN